MILLYQYNPNTPTASEIWLTPGIYYFKVCAAVYGINQWKCTNTEMLIIPGPDGETLASVNTGAISEITHNSAICGRLCLCQVYDDYHAYIAL